MLSKIPHAHHRRITSFPLILFLSALLLILGVSAAWYVRHLYDDLSNVLELNVASVRVAEELEKILGETKTRLDPAEDDLSRVDLERVLALRPATERWLDEANRLSTTPKEKELMLGIIKNYGKFVTEIERISLAPDPSSVRHDVRVLIDEILERELMEPAHEYLDFNEETMIAVAKEHRIFSERFSWLLVVTATCGSFGGFFAGLQAAKRIRRSIVELNLPISAAAGKLSEVAGPVRVATFLDFNELQRVLETIAGEVDDVVTKLQKSQEEVLKSEKLAAVGQLAAGTAHEIRNPLMAIKLLVQAALNQSTEERLTRFELELIENEISRVESTVKNLLDFARPPQLARKIFDVNELVSYCTALIAGRAAIQGVEILKNVDENPLRFEGDFQQLHQVVLNLLLNSLDAMPDGGLLTLQVEAIESESAVQITVKDTGSGIGKDEIDRIFEPFVSTKSSGTGIGLSISKQIVEAHCGEMFAYNLTPVGSAVGFRLPLTDPRISFRT